MTASSTIVNREGKTVQTIELATAAVAYNATQNEQNARAHDRALIQALVSSGDVDPTKVGWN